MNRDQMTAALDWVVKHAGEAVISAGNAAASARIAEMQARRLREALDAKPAPEPPVVEPEPPGEEPGFIGSVVGEPDGGVTLNLREVRRQRCVVDFENSLCYDSPPHPFFVEVFITERAGITETVCVLHNGAPKGRGAIRIPKLEVLTHDGRSIFDWQGPVTIPPGRMLPVVDYHCAAAPQWSDAANRRTFWGSDITTQREWPFAATHWDSLVRLNDLLNAELNKRVASPESVGPYDVWWDKEGARGGGQGIEPHRFEWRKNFASGIALAAMEMYGVASRTGRCMTDDEGAFDWDRSVGHTSVGSFMPDAFKWKPQTQLEHALNEWKDIDGQHFIRAYSAALFIYKQTKHPFAKWYLEMLANWQEAVHLGTAFDDDKNSAWWSLEKKIAATDGPNEFCGRSWAHEFRFLDACGKLGIGQPGTTVTAGQHWELYRWAHDTNGNPFAAPASIFTSEHFPKRWGETKSAQAFELQLIVLALRDSDATLSRENADRLAGFLTDSPPYSYNLETGERLGRAHSYFELSTHGKFDSDMDALVRLSISRIEASGVEAGGANPLNYLNPALGIVKQGEAGR